MFFTLCDLVLVFEPIACVNKCPLALIATKYCRVSQFCPSHYAVSTQKGRLQFTKNNFEWIMKFEYIWNITLTYEKVNFSMFKMSSSSSASVLLCICVPTHRLSALTQYVAAHTPFTHSRTKYQGKHPRAPNTFSEEKLYKCKIECHWECDTFCMCSNDIF